MMPGDKNTNSHSSAAGLNSDGCVNLGNQNVIPRKVGIPSDVTLSSVSSVNDGVRNKGVVEESVHYPPTMCYDHHYPGNNGSYHQSDGSCHQNCGGPTSYTDNSSLVYFMPPGYNPYAPSQAFLGVDGQNCHYSSSECTPCYSWNDAGYQNHTSANGSAKFYHGVNSKRSMMTSFNERLPNYPLDMQSRKPSFNFSQSALHSHLCSLNKSGGACHCGGITKSYQQQCPKLSSFSYQKQALYASYNSIIQSPKMRESDELTCGPRAHNIIMNHVESENSSKNNQYNLDDFQTSYEEAKFYIIKSYSEDDVHKCVKYDVWSSTPSGNKKLDVAFHEAKENGSRCPVFLFFSVNGSGQFVGVAEMVGPVVFEKNMDFWQLDKWSGFFPVKWHIIKDIPNTHLRHIILETNDNRPVTYTRDTQEVGLEQGLEMLKIFKSYPEKTSLLDDLSFYENREKLLKARRIGKLAFQPEKNFKSGQGSVSSSLINLTTSLSLS